MWLVIMAARVADADIIFSSCGYFFLLLFFPCLMSAAQTGCLPYFHTWCGLSANLGCRSETCCTRLAENTGCKNLPSTHHRTTLSDCIFATKVRYIPTIGKKPVKQQYLPHVSLHYGELGPLAAEIGSLVWGTQANFNGFRVLAVLLHGTLLLGISQTLWC